MNRDCFIKILKRITMFRFSNQFIYSATLVLNLNSIYRYTKSISVLSECVSSNLKELRKIVRTWGFKCGISVICLLFYIVYKDIFTMKFPLLEFSARQILYYEDWSISGTQLIGISLPTKNFSWLQNLSSSKTFFSNLNLNEEKYRMNMFENEAPIIQFIFKLLHYFVYFKQIFRWFFHSKTNKVSLVHSGISVLIKI